MGSAQLNSLARPTCSPACHSSDGCLWLQVQLDVAGLSCQRTFGTNKVSAWIMNWKVDGRSVAGWALANAIARMARTPIAELAEQNRQTTVQKLDVSRQQAKHVSRHCKLCWMIEIQSACMCRGCKVEYGTPVYKVQSDISGTYDFVSLFSKKSQLWPCLFVFEKEP